MARAARGRRPHVRGRGARDRRLLPGRRRRARSRASTSCPSAGAAGSARALLAAALDELRAARRPRDAVGVHRQPRRRARSTPGSGSPPTAPSASTQGTGARRDPAAGGACELGRAGRRGADRHRPAAGRGGGAGRLARRAWRTALAARGAEDRLLGAAAAWTVARRAGALAGAARSRSTRGRRGRRAARSAPGRAAAVRCSRATIPSLLAEWLALVAERGLRPPPELVPDAARPRRAATPSLHAAVGAAAGPLGRWLAERAPRWAFVRGAGDDVEAVWADGERAERRALLERLRRTDPAAARELLERDVRRRDLGGPRRVRRRARRTGSPTPTSRCSRPRSTTAASPSATPPPTLLARPAALALRRPHGGARRAAAARRGRPRSSSTLPGRAGRGRAARRRRRPAAAAPSASRALLAATPLRRTWTLDARRRLPGRRRPRPTSSTRGWARGGGRAARRGVGAGAVAGQPDPELLLALPRDEARARSPRRRRDPTSPRRRCPGRGGRELSKAVIDAIQRRREAGERGQDVAFAGHRLDPGARARGRGAAARPRRARPPACCATSSAPGLPCCASCRDRRDATPPAPRRAALRRRAGRARARRRPAAPAAVAALAVGGDDLPARRRGGRHDDHAEVRRPAAAGRARRRDARHRPRAAPARRPGHGQDVDVRAPQRGDLRRQHAGRPGHRGHARGGAALRLELRAAARRGPVARRARPRPGVPRDAGRQARPRRGAHADPVRRAGRADHDPVARRRCRSPSSTTRSRPSRAST